MVLVLNRDMSGIHKRQNSCIRVKKRNIQYLSKIQKYA